ncbi:MAG: succinylglutamate desuccinylase/aspartoacylase family protein [Gammaproteobacteria bacterium]|nr:succinylglutamate desuccinylase/aspartoacylase family protein [Gammaproteobacteria bacterium]
MLHETDTLPNGLLEADATELKRLLGSPTLIHLPGEKREPLFICTLLHGNETTGFYAIQRLLKQYQNKPLPRAVSIFIGNVDAAAVAQRRLDQQPDYNRIWPGTHHDDCAETDMMKTIANIMYKRKTFASIDIHNNTGLNPHYACVNILNPHCIQLAGMFGTTVVYFTSPKGVQSAAFSDFCPAVVLECGQSGQADGVTHSTRYLQAVLNTDKLPSEHPSHINLFHTVARVTVPEIFSLGTDNNADIHLSYDLENMNFEQLGTGSIFAGLKPESEAHLVVTNESSEDITSEFFEIADSKIVLRKNATLSMYTTNERAIRQDCLCYLMEQIHVG